MNEELTWSITYRYKPEFLEIQKAPETEGRNERTLMLIWSGASFLSSVGEAAFCSGAGSIPCGRRDAGSISCSMRELGSIPCCMRDESDCAFENKKRGPVKRQKAEAGGIS
jgi:hypothetical protein